MRPRSTLLLAGALALSACDPAGPASVGLTPLGTAGTAPVAAGGQPGAPLDAMRPEVSPMAAAPATADEAASTAPPEDTGSPVALAAAATAAVSDAPAPSGLATDTAALSAFARGARHSVGTAVHLRDFASPERAERACARYASADQAQSAFLAAGGPVDDPRGLDPDGDGYACGWDPAAFRGGSAG